MPKFEKTNWQLTVDASIAESGKIPTGTPDSSANGTVGQFQQDASYLYIATSTNNWMRILGVSPY